MALSVGGRSTGGSCGTSTGGRSSGGPCGTSTGGASGDDTGGTDAGAPYVFQRNEGGANNCGQVRKLTASDAQADDLFGYGLAVSGDTAVVGAYKESAGGSNAGAAYVFQAPPKQPFPGDTDGDGCPDQRENGPDKTQGGLRDYKNPWAFYDTNGDGLIDLFNNTLGVINHSSLDGSPPYDAACDCGPSSGPNAWNMSAPDGVIDLLTDISGVIQQYSHDCW